MLKSRKLGAVLSAVAISFFGLNGSAFAESSDLQVGTDSNGLPIMLDAKSITKKTYRLYQSYEGGIIETTFEPSCSDARLFTANVSVYSSTGRLIHEDKSSEEIFYKPGSAAAESLKVYCQLFHARGW